MSTSSDLTVQQHVQHWIESFVEQPNEFYQYQFAVCPWARAARERGHSLLLCYSMGNPWRWLQQQVQELIQHQQYQVGLFVLPPLMRNVVTRLKIHAMNQNIIGQDYFALMGSTVGLSSAYPWYWGRGEYTVVGVNRLSRVLPAVETLKQQGYYDNWSQQHLQQVVQHRQRMHERYRKKD